MTRLAFDAILASIVRHMQAISWFSIVRGKAKFRGCCVHEAESDAYPDYDPASLFRIIDYPGLGDRLVNPWALIASDRTVAVPAREHPAFDFEQSGWQE